MRMDDLFSEVSINNKDAESKTAIPLSNRQNHDVPYSSLSDNDNDRESDNRNKTRTVSTGGLSTFLPPELSAHRGEDNADEPIDTARSRKQDFAQWINQQTDLVDEMSFASLSIYLGTNWFNHLDDMDLQERLLGTACSMFLNYCLGSYFGRKGLELYAGAVQSLPELSLRSTMDYLAVSLVIPFIAGVAGWMYVPGDKILADQVSNPYLKNLLMLNAYGCILKSFFFSLSGATPAATHFSSILKKIWNYVAVISPSRWDQEFIVQSQEYIRAETRRLIKLIKDEVYINEDFADKLYQTLLPANRVGSGESLPVDLPPIELSTLLALRSGVSSSLFDPARPQYCLMRQRLNNFNDYLLVPILTATIYVITLTSMSSYFTLAVEENYELGMATIAVNSFIVALAASGIPCALGDKMLHSLLGLASSNACTILTGLCGNLKSLLSKGMPAAFIYLMAYLTASGALGLFEDNEEAYLVGNVALLGLSLFSLRAFVRNSTIAGTTFLNGWGSISVLHESLQHLDQTIMSQQHNLSHWAVLKKRDNIRNSLSSMVDYARLAKQEGVFSVASVQAAAQIIRLLYNILSGFGHLLWTIPGKVYQGVGLVSLYGARCLLPAVNDEVDKSTKIIRALEDLAQRTSKMSSLDICAAVQVDAKSEARKQQELILLVAALKNGFYKQLLDDIGRISLAHESKADSHHETVFSRGSQHLPPELSVWREFCDRVEEIKAAKPPIEPEKAHLINSSEVFDEEIKHSEHFERDKTHKQAMTQRLLGVIAPLIIAGVMTQLIGSDMTGAEIAYIASAVLLTLCGLYHTSRQVAHQGATLVSEVVSACIPAGAGFFAQELTRGVLHAIEPLASGDGYEDAEGAAEAVGLATTTMVAAYLGK